MVTFYFTHKFLETPSSQFEMDRTSKQSKEDEDEALALIDAYGSYLDVYRCLVLAGKLHSKVLVDKLLGVAKYDSHHKEAVKALRKAKVILFYEPVSTL